MVQLLQKGGNKSWNRIIGHINSWVENVFWWDYNYAKKYLWIYNCQEVLNGAGIIIIKDTGKIKINSAKFLGNKIKTKTTYEINTVVIHRSSKMWLKEVMFIEYLQLHHYV